MPSHYWGDESFDWDALHKAIDLISSVCRRFGRIGMHPKEKYGTMRDQLYPFDGSLYSVIKPGYVYVRWPKWLYRLDQKICKPVLEYTGIAFLMIKWQMVVYNFAVQRACKKWPHIIDEIVSDLDGYEWVKPGIFGPISGTEIHKKYWVTYK